MSSDSFAEVAPEVDPPEGGQTEPPGTTETEPPGTTETEPPVTTETEPPGTTETEPPGTTETEPPGTTETEPPGTTETEPPGTTETEPPGTTETEPPGTTETEPPTIEEQLTGATADLDALTPDALPEGSVARSKIKADADKMSVEKLWGKYKKGSLKIIGKEDKPVQKAVKKVLDAGLSSDLSEWSDLVLNSKTYDEAGILTKTAKITDTIKQYDKTLDLMSQGKTSLRASASIAMMRQTLRVIASKMSKELTFLSENGVFTSPE